MVRTRDFVRTVLGPRYMGRVMEVHSSFAESGATMDWFRMQTHEWPKDTLNERWVSILVDGGGAVLFPESALEQVSPFPLSNRDTREKFGRCLVDWLPREFLLEYHDTKAAKLLDRTVLKSWSLGGISASDEKEWKPEKNVMNWCMLEDGHSVGWNENPSRGWSFPVIWYEEE